jgi:hypothetical protein
MLDEPSLVFGNDGGALSLTPEQATERLDAMRTALHPPPEPTPIDAQGARQMLDKLTKDPSWAKALLRGDPQATKQLADLTALSAAGDEVGDTVAGIVEPSDPLIEFTFGGNLTRRQIAEAVAGFREDGLSDASIEQAMQGGAVTVAEYRAAAALQSARHSDPAWVKRLLSGDYEAKREHTLLSIILSSQIAGPT